MSEVGDYLHPFLGVDFCDDYVDEYWSVPDRLKWDDFCRQDYVRNDDILNYFLDKMMEK